MNQVYMLDSGPLGAIAHPRAKPQFARKIDALLQEETTVVIIPEICDYEVRRNLILENKTLSIEKLDRLKQVLGYLPLTTDAMLKAAEFWAETRRKGRVTADPKALDGDVILAAQATLVNATVITDNRSHLDQFVPVIGWEDL